MELYNIGNSDITTFLKGSNSLCLQHKPNTPILWKDYFLFLSKVRLFKSLKKHPKNNYLSNCYDNPLGLEKGGLKL